MTQPATLIELGLVLIGLAFLARLAGLIGIPTIPLYLLAGLAFGKGGVLPLVTTGEFIQIGAEIGLILMLFSLGLEYSARELVTTLRRQARAGVIDAALNFTPGFVAGLLLGQGPITSALLGGITYVSSSGIAAKLLHDFGWTRKREAVVVVPLLVLEDLAMAVYLPIVAGPLIAGGFTAAGILGAAVAVAAVVILLTAALRIDVGLTRFVFSRSDEGLLFTILGLAVLGAGLAELIQVSAAVGALLVGIGMSGPGIEGAKSVLAPLRDFFAAMFFAFFGLSIDPGDFTWSIAGIALVLAAVTAATKMATGYAVGRRAGLDARGSVRAAALLVARGEFSIVIATIGVASGIEPIGPVAAAYVLALSVGGPLLAVLVTPRDARSSRPPRGVRQRHDETTPEDWDDPWL